VSGSQYDRTHRQIRQAKEHHTIRLIDVRPDRYNDPDPNAFSLEDIHDDGIVLIRLSSDAAQPKDVTPSQLLKWFLSKVHTLMFHLKPDAIGIIGGETVFSLFKSLNIHTLRVQGRISDVMPHGSIIDGHLAGCIFSSKGGSVGSDDSVTKMIQFFRGA
jgi:uncharacterized protein YgbK (DUF1537 family)